MLGVEPPSPGARVQRLEEFVQLLDLLLTQPVTTWRGEWFSAVEARMVPGSVQRPRMPFVVAANGPKGIAVAARRGDAWATTGAPASSDGADGQDAWWRGVAGLVARFEDAAAEAGRDPARDAGGT